MSATEFRDRPPPSPLPEIQLLRMADLAHALRAGWRDFCRAPEFGLFFSAIYVVTGLVLRQVGAGQLGWTLALSLGFPLYAPFAAVGLYEVSRRIERNQPLNWREILGVVWAERARQVPWLGAIIVIYFLFWTFLAYMIFALFMGLHPTVNLADGWRAFLTPEGLRMIAVECTLGAVLAFFLYSMVVVSLPMLLDRELDFVTAMLHSISTVRENLAVMLVWAFVIAALTLVALMPWFLGLFIVLPVLGHATWHLYRRALD